MGRTAGPSRVGVRGSDILRTVAVRRRAGGARRCLVRPGAEGAGVAAAPAALLQRGEPRPGRAAQRRALPAPRAPADDVEAAVEPDGVTGPPAARPARGPARGGALATRARGSARGG